LERAAIKEFEEKHGRKPEPYEDTRRGFSWHSLREIEGRVGRAQNFLESPHAKLANLPVLLLAGEAGSGKTHLLCNTIDSLLRTGVPAILLLGEQFHSGEPFTQILSLLGLNCTRDEFLGAFDAAAEAAGVRAVLIIDALNEGEGLKIWRHHFSSFLAHVRRWPRLAVCISIRNGYQKAVLPDSVTEKTLVAKSHQGFANIELEAAARFFEYFGITAPSVPVLSPEFANPLFLKLFCRAIQNAGLTEIPSGLRGITAVFEFFLETVNEKLSRPTALNFDSASCPVHKAVDRLAEMMVTGASPVVPLATVQGEFEKILPSSGYENSLERRLRVESVLARQPQFNFDTEEVEEVVRFTYQRFTDHRIIGFLLKHVRKSDVAQIFKKNSALWGLLDKAGWYFQTQGLWDALALQLPEKFGTELPDILRRGARNTDLRDAFLSSLVWRDRNSFTLRTDHWLRDYRDSSDEGYARVMDTLISVSTCRDHPFNADFLNSFLAMQSMPQRDAEWSIFLFSEYGEDRGVDRLIEWATSERAHISCDEETARLSAIALVWFLTTSHRFLRDRATKALVSLLHIRLPVLRRILRLFQQVDDPYVSERLYAVTFGCALITDDLNELQLLGQQVYDDVFRDDAPPADIILRDYAKGVVQTALNHNALIEGDMQRIVPPYKSKWPARIPTLETLEKRIGDWGTTEEQRGARRLFHSVTNDDFSHYEMGDLRMWAPRRLGKNSKKSPLQIYKSFEATLSEIERDYIGKYEIAVRGLVTSELGLTQSDLTVDERRNAVAEFESALAEALGKKRGRIFRTTIVPLFRDSGKPMSDEGFNKELLQRWILNWALSHGWTKERFGLFDDRVGSRGRESYKPERLGKKYQWMALHEFYARMSDNFEFAEGFDAVSQADRQTGRWTNEFRDIDPSLLIRSTQSDGWGANHSSWWTPVRYDDWLTKPTKLKWLKSTADLPKPENLIDLIRPCDQTEWLQMEGYVSWKRREQIGSIGSEEPETQEIWYILRSYLVSQSDFAALRRWSANQRWMGDWMPRAYSRLRVGLYEHYWPPRFQVPLEKEWDTEIFGIGHKLPCSILLTNDEYLCERGTYDCSVDDTININLPCRWLVKKMGLKMMGRRGEFYDDQGMLVAFDPSTLERGPSTLLIRKEPFSNFLKRNHYRVFWTVVGEKNIYEPGLGSREQWLGRLEINGACFLNRGHVDCNLRSNFQPGGSTKDVKFT
jgi:hypothetical protein